MLSMRFLAKSVLIASGQFLFSRAGEAPWFEFQSGLSHKNFEYFVSFL